MKMLIEELEKLDDFIDELIERNTPKDLLMKNLITIELLQNIMYTIKINFKDDFEFLKKENKKLKEENKELKKYKKIMEPLEKWKTI